MTRKHGIVIFCLGLFIIALAPGRGRATLGGTVDSIESDRRAFSAVRRSAVTGDRYTVHEIDYDATVVREYASPDGVVFAIVWNGMRTPDLAALLGSYADQYNKALANTPRRPGVRHGSVKADDVVVERWGQVRNLQGRAYVPALIPASVNIYEIK